MLGENQLQIMTLEDSEKIDRALKSCEYRASEIEGVFTNRLPQNGFTTHAAGGLIKGNATGDGVIAVIPNDMKQISQDFSDKNYLDNVLNSIAPGALGKPHKKIQIIGPYNAGGHWYTCEVNIVKSGEEYTCTTYLHNPFGCGQLEDSAERGNLRRHIMTTLFKNLKEGEIVRFKFPSSPYKSKRQHDCTSCGPIVAEEIIQLATTGKITQRHYPEGAIDIRRAQLKSLIAQEAEKPEGFNTLVSEIKDKNILSEAEIAEINEQANNRVASLQNEELCNAIAAEIFKPNVTLRSDVLNLANDNPVRAEKLKELNSSLDSTKLLLEQLQPIDQGSEEQEERSDLSAVITCIEQLRDEEEELVELDDWNTYSQATLAGLQGFLQEYQGVHGSFPDIFKSQEAKCLKKLEETYIEGLKTEAVKGKLKIYSASLEHTTPKSKPAAKGKEASISKPKSDGAYNEASNNSAKSEKVNNGVIIYNSLVGAGIALITIAVAVFIIGEGKKSELARRLTGAFLVLGAISAVAAIITRCLTPGTAMQAAQVSANTVANPGK